MCSFIHFSDASQQIFNDQRLTSLRCGRFKGVNKAERCGGGRGETSRDEMETGPNQESPSVLPTGESNTRERVGVGGGGGRRKTLVFHLDSNSTGLRGTIKASEEEVLSFLNALGRAY